MRSDRLARFTLKKTFNLEINSNPLIIPKFCAIKKTGVHVFLKIVRKLRDLAGFPVDYLVFYLVLRHSRRKLATTSVTFYMYLKKLREAIA